ISIEEARKEQLKEMQEVFANGLDYEWWPNDDPRRICPEPSTVTIFGDPPGVGKTHAMHRAQPVEVLRPLPTAILSPTVDLSEESEARHADHLRKLGVEGLTNRVVGREKLCINAEMNERAKMFEAAGLSPKRPVCDVCPDQDGCEYFKQTFWLKAGANY